MDIGRKKGITMNEYINKITHADCMDVLKELPDSCVDLVLTDIPYNEVNRDSNGLRNLDMDVADVFDIELDELLGQLTRVNKTNGSIYIFCGINQISPIREFLLKKKYSTRLMIWEKTNPSPMNGETIWLSGIEACVYGKLSGATFNGHCRNTVLRYPLCSDKDRFHKTQKPLSLMSDLVETSSNEGDLVLDPFSGSGTTAIACSKLKRNFIALEKNTEYYEKSVARLKKERMKKRLV